MNTTAPRHTEFGHEIRRMAAEKGVYSVNDLLRALRTAGYTKGRQTLSNYLQGTTVVDPKFVRQVAAALDLSQDERNTLAMIFAYGEVEQSEGEAGFSQESASSPQNVA